MEPKDTKSPEVIESDCQTVVFRLSDESYGIDIFRVNEIIRPREITPIPLSEPHILGLVNLRGKTIPVVDLRNRLQLAATEQSTASRIIVVETGQGNVGMMVDAVTEVVTIKRDEISPAPEIVADEDTDFVKAIAKRDQNLITLLDLDRALAA
jgi:purine-binding chemotaxis protein CheW